MKNSNTDGFFSEALFDDSDRSAKQNDYFYPVMKDLDKLISLEGKDVLDIGCGTGIFLAPHAKKFSSLTGVDGEEKVIARALKNGYDRVTVIEDFCSSMLPCNDCSIDIVICKDVFEHLIDPKHLLREINRILKVGGTLLFHVPNHFPLNKRIRFLFNSDLDTYKFFPGYDSWNNPHLRFYNLRDIITNFKSEGFSEHCDLSYHFPSFPLSLFGCYGRNAVKWLQMAFPDQFNAGYTIVTKKA